jgi:cytoskeletal protein RodZ
MRRSITLVSTWVVATLAAIGLAWAGVGLVADQVAEPVRPLDVVAATPSSSPASSPDATPSPSSAPTASPTPVPDDGGAAEPPAVTGTSDDSDDDAPSGPDDDEGEDASAETRSYRLVGGTVTISYSATRVDVVVATPADGFDVEVERDGPTDLRVEFTGDDHESRLDASWEEGPRDRIREEAED